MPDLVTALTADQMRTAWHWISEDSYWARAIPWDLFRRSCRGSRVFGLVENGRLLAFARVVSDGATFAWLCDVFVDPAARGRGLGKTLMTGILEDPGLRDLRRWGLATADAHGLYERHGFTPADPTRHMERVDRGLYARVAAST